MSTNNCVLSYTVLSFGNFFVYKLSKIICLQNQHKMIQIFVGKQTSSINGKCCLMHFKNTQSDFVNEFVGLHFPTKLSAAITQTETPNLLH